MQETPAKIKALLDTARHYRDVGDYNGGIAFLNTTFSKGAKHPILIYESAKYLAQIKNFKSANAILDIVKTDFPNYFEELSDDLYGRMADNYFKQALTETSPKDKEDAYQNAFECYNALSETLRKTQQFKIEFTRNAAINPLYTRNISFNPATDKLGGVIKQKFSNAGKLTSNGRIPMEKVFPSFFENLNNKAEWIAQNITIAESKRGTIEGKKAYSNIHQVLNYYAKKQYWELLLGAAEQVKDRVDHNNVSFYGLASKAARKMNNLQKALEYCEAGLNAFPANEILETEQEKVLSLMHAHAKPQSELNLQKD